MIIDKNIIKKVSYDNIASDASPQAVLVFKTHPINPDLACLLRTKI